MRPGGRFQTNPLEAPTVDPLPRGPFRCSNDSPEVIRVTVMLHIRCFQLSMASGGVVRTFPSLRIFD